MCTLTTMTGAVSDVNTYHGVFTCTYLQATKVIPSVARLVSSACPFTCSQAPAFRAYKRQQTNQRWSRNISTARTVCWLTESSENQTASTKIMRISQSYYSGQVGKLAMSISELTIRYTTLFPISTSKVWARARIYLAKQ